LFGASFQLTFLAVFIIAGIGFTDFGADDVALRARLRLLRAASYDLRVAPEVAQFRLDLRLIGEDCGDLSARISVWLCQRFFSA